MSAIRYEESAAWNTNTGGQLHCYGSGDIAGSVATEYGYVSVYALAGFSRLEFIYKKINYVRVHDAYFSTRYLVTAARRFAADVIAQAAPKEEDTNL